MKMRRNAACLLFCAPFVLLGVGEKDQFTPPAVEQMEKQTISEVTIAAQAFDTEVLCKPPFGKVNPNKYGVLPVWVVVKNNSKKSVKLDGAMFQYHDLNRNKIEATPANEVRFANSPKRPRMSPSPLPFPLPKGKNPLEAFEIEGRSFAAKMLPPGESAQGFVYFQTDHRGGEKLYVTGLRDAATGEELFFFEVPLKSH